MSITTVYTQPMFVDLLTRARSEDPGLKVQRLRMPTTIPHHRSDGRVEMRAAITSDYLFTRQGVTYSFRETKVADDGGEIALETDFDRWLLEQQRTNDGEPRLEAIHRSGSL